MKITITKPAGLVTVDGVARPVNLSTLNAGVEVVFWNSVKNAGFIQWSEDVQDEVTERDVEGEELENARLRANNKDILQEPLYRKVLVHRQPTAIASFAPYQQYLDAWNAYIPPPPPPPDPAIEADAADARNQTLGTVQPLTVTQLKAMTRAEIRTWFDANFTTNAQLSRVVRWMFVFFIRRLL